MVINVSDVSMHFTIFDDDSAAVSNIETYDAMYIDLGTFILA